MDERAKVIILIKALTVLTEHPEKIEEYDFMFSMEDVVHMRDALHRRYKEDPNHADIITAMAVLHRV